MNDHSHSARAGLLVLYASILLLALNGFFAKVIPLEAASVTQVRSVVASIAILLVLLAQKTSFRLGSIKEYLGVYGLGLLLCIHWVTYFYSIRLATVAVGMVALFSYPVMTVLIEPFFKKQRPKLIDLAAACVMLFGVFLMVSDDILSGDLGSGAFLGASWGVFSAFIFALRNTSQKYLFPHVNSISLMGHQTLAVALMLVPFISVSEIQSLSMKSWGYILLLGCFSTAAAHTFLSMSLKRLSAKTVGLISCMTPVFGAGIAWALLDETPAIIVFFGGAIVLSVAIWETIKGRAA